MDKWIPSEAVLKAVERNRPYWEDRGKTYQLNLPCDTRQVWHVSLLTFGGDWHPCHTLTVYEAQAILLKFWTDKCDAEHINVFGCGEGYRIDSIAYALRNLIGKWWPIRLDALAAVVLALAEKEEGHA